MVLFPALRQQARSTDTTSRCATATATRALSGQVASPLDANGGPLLSFPHAQQPATPDASSLVPDIDTSLTTASPAPPPQLRHHTRSTEPEFCLPTAPSSAASHRRKRANDDDAAFRSPSPTEESRLSDSTFANSCKEQLQTHYRGCCVTLCKVHAVDVLQPQFEGRSAEVLFLRCVIKP